MAATVTWETLRGLAAFRSESGCAISVYLDLDPSVAPTAADAQTRFNSLLSEAEKSEGAKREGLSHDQKGELESDFGRMRRYFDEEFSREGTRGLALFAAGGDGAWHAVPLAERVPSSVTIDGTFHLAPLVPLVGRGDGALVAVVGREQGHVYRLRDGRLVEVADHSEEQPRRHDQGGWSQARFQRHIDTLATEHLRTVAEELDRQIRRSNGIDVVVVCAEEKRSQFNELLAPPTRAVVAGWETAEAHAGPSELLSVVEPVLEERREAREREALERWRGEAGTEGRASSGWQATLEAASDGRVELLLFQEDADRPAFRCPACGRAGAEGGPCPLDGTALEQSESALDLAVHQTLAHGGELLAVRRSPDLQPVEGVGAVLRF